MESSTPLVLHDSLPHSVHPTLTYVPIQHQHPVHTRMTQRLPRGHGDVVIEAESHSPCALRMVPGRAHLRGGNMDKCRPSVDSEGQGVEEPLSNGIEMKALSSATDEQ